MRVVALVLAGAVAACAPMEPREATPTTQVASPCFYPRQIQNFRTDRSEVLYVRVGRDRVFRLNALGTCPDLNGAVALTLVPRFRATDRLCGGDEARVVISQPTPTFPSPCDVRVAAALSPEEIAALEDRVRP